MDNVDIRARLQALRVKHRLSQEQLAQILGFKDRQTLSAIETGDRRISPAEMVRAAKHFNVGLDYFTDPFELAGEGSFSWRRQKKARDGEIDELEQTAGRWIAAFRYLSRLKGEPVNSSLRRVALHDRSSFEEAWDQGEAIAAALKLPDPPAKHLADVVQEQLDTLVLYVDTARTISGAACRLEQLNAILVNRHEFGGRRAYDLAHELFHLLTWDSMPPKRIEGYDESASAREKRVEQLAENFAGALLMPRWTIAAFLTASPIPTEKPNVPRWLIESGRRLGVSPTALKWRLKILGHIDKKFADEIMVKDPATDRSNEELPARFGKRFVATMAWGIEEGHLSVRKAASLLCLTLDDLAELFSEHGLRAPFEL